MSTKEKLLQDWILPQAIKSGCFGENVYLENFTIDTNEKPVDQFASEIIFVQLDIRKPNENEVKKYNVVIKVQLQNETYRKIVNTSAQFSNEILMYETLLPMLDRNGIVQEVFCRYYCGYNDPNDPTKDFVVLEDLRKDGYRLSSEKVFLDYKHCSLAMTELGKFHALSYLTKCYSLSQLLSTVSKIKDKWNDEVMLQCQEMIQLCGKRGIQPLIDNGESVELLKPVLNEYNDVVKLQNYLIQPVEPEAVLCHGDFNRNNLLFRYDENHLTGLKMIDLQTPRYSSPVIDLSFFLFMNTTHTLRKEHLNDLLDIYQQSLMSTVSNNCIVPELDFGRVALYGYIICSFFLPMMMVGSSIDEILIEDTHKRALQNSQRGGERETQALIDIVKDMLHFGYVRKNYTGIH